MGSRCLGLRNCFLSHAVACLWTDCAHKPPPIHEFPMRISYRFRPRLSMRAFQGRPQGSAHEICGILSKCGENRFTFGNKRVMVKMQTTKNWIKRRRQHEDLGCVFGVLCDSVPTPAGGGGRARQRHGKAYNVEVRSVDVVYSLDGTFRALETVRTTGRQENVNSVRFAYDFEQEQAEAAGRFLEDQKVALVQVDGFDPADRARRGGGPRGRDRGRAGAAGGPRRGLCGLRRLAQRAQPGATAWSFPSSSGRRAGRRRTSSR